MTREQKIEALGRLAVDGMDEIDRMAATMPEFMVPTEYSIDFAMEGRAWRLSIEPVEA